LAGTSSDGAQSAPSRTTPTPQAYLSPDRMTAFSRLSRFGMTFAPLTDGIGEGVLTWFRADFPAPTSAQPARAQASTAPPAASGPRWHALSVRFDPGSSSWKTHRCLFQEDLPESSVTLPRWGMMRGGELWERDTPERLTGVTGSGLWPTAMASCARSEGMIGQMRSLVDAGKVTREEAEAMIGGSLEPARMAMWPTPKASAAGPDFAKMDRSATGISLQTAVAMFPTPKSLDGKGQSQRGIHAPGDALPNMDRGDGTVIGGSLNPTWVEWLMGWPLGWTDLSASATDKYREWLRSHGKS